MGTRSLTGITVTTRLAATVQNTLIDGSVASVAHPNLNYRLTLTSGVDASQANRAWQYSGSLAKHGSQVILDLLNMTGIDIGAGSGLDGVGQAVVFENIVAIQVVNDNDVGDAGQLEVMPSTSNGWTPIGTHTVATGGALGGQGTLMKADPREGGFDVVSASSHRITLRANGGPVEYSVYLLARHDDEASSSSSVSSQSSSLSSESSSSSSVSSISTSSSSVSTSSVSTSSVSSSSWSSASSNSSSSSGSSSSSSSSSTSSSESSSSLSSTSSSSTS